MRIVRGRGAGRAGRRPAAEITVGENAMEFTPDEVVDLLRDLRKRAIT
jgi:hypothetical protein